VVNHVVLCISLFISITITFTFLIPVLLMSCVFGTSTVHTNLSPDLDDGQDSPHPTVLHTAFCIYTYLSVFGFLSVVYISISAAALPIIYLSSFRQLELYFYYCIFSFWYHLSTCRQLINRRHFVCIQMKMLPAYEQRKYIKRTRKYSLINAFLHSFLSFFPIYFFVPGQFQGLK